MGSFLTRRDRPRILYVIQQHDYSGAELMHLPVLLADVDPLLACPPGSRTEALARRHGVPTVPLPFRSLRHSGGLLETVRSAARGLRTAWDLRRLLRAHPDRPLVYCTSLRPGMLVALAKLGMRRRALWMVTDLLPPAPLRQLVRLLAVIGCDRAAPLSRFAAADFVGRSSRLRARTVVAYPGAHLDSLEPGRCEPGCPRAAILGHVSPTKRTDLALDIARRVAEEEPGFKLVIIGRAQYRDADFEFEREMKARVEADEILRRCVDFVGYADDVSAELSKVGLLLHCRPDEPLGIALIEAMEMGLPVVAPAAGGPLEIVEHGVSGLLYPPGESERAAEHVVRLIRDPHEAARIGLAGRASVGSRFSADVYVDAIDALLEEMTIGWAGRSRSSR